jgi:hypothetical protein
MLFVAPDECYCEMVLTITGVTDNRDNETLLNKCMSSKFLWYAILLELTEQLQLRNRLLDLRWQPREMNQAADDLTNEKFEAFSLKNRLSLSLSSMPWLVLPKRMTDAGDLHRIMEQKKIDREASSKKETANAKRTFLPVKRKALGLRVTDPW